MVKWLLAGLVALMAVEITAFALVAALIGLPQAFLLMAATSFMGVVVLRQPSRGRIDEMHEAVSKTGLPGIEAGGNAFLSVAAGILLLLPGFITDAVGLLLLLPPVRQWIGARFLGYVQTSQPGPAVVDLDRRDWSQVPDRQIDHRQDHAQPKSDPP
jgi:UPF0716 protein FxsA